jgi:hypothetical protein
MTIARCRERSNPTQFVNVLRRYFQCRDSWLLLLRTDIYYIVRLTFDNYFEFRAVSEAVDHELDIAIINVGQFSG